MNRKRNFEDIDWEVTSIKYTGLERPWRVWWSVGGPPSELPTRCLAGISEELKKHAREWEGTEVLLDVTHLRFDEDQLQVKRESKDGWNNVEREQVFPDMLDRLDGMPDSLKQHEDGVELTSESSHDEGCCSFAVLSLFPVLNDFKADFEPFKFGAISGDFINFLRTQNFGGHRIQVRNLKLRFSHPFDFLTSEDRKHGDKYLVLVSKSHMVGVEFILTDLGLAATIHCAKNPTKQLDLTWENFKKVGGSKNAGQMWKVKYLSPLE